MRLFSHLSLPVWWEPPWGGFPTHFPGSGEAQDFSSHPCTPSGQSCRLWDPWAAVWVGSSPTGYLTTVKMPGSFCFSAILLVCETRTQTPAPLASLAFTIYISNKLSEFKGAHYFFSRWVCQSWTWTSLCAWRPWSFNSIKAFHPNLFTSLTNHLMTNLAYGIVKICFLICLSLCTCS